MRISQMILGWVCVCLLSSLPAFAQTTSNIEGTIKDPKGAVVAGAEIKLTSSSLAIERTTTSDEEGFYRITALPAGIYSLTVSARGFSNSTVENVELTLNRTLTLNLELEVSGVKEQVSITSELLVIDSTSAATGTTVTPQQIRDMPVNGRNYLDLLQLVPGAVINRQANVGADNSTPVLGERSGNNNFMIDGQPNKNTVTGGAATQFNQETIAEFQVLTTGYKAEFGQASGAIVNVITRSGNNEYHGVGSFFLRHDAFDTSNSLNPNVTDALPLRRYDYSLALGGPIVKDKVFFFGSGERIHENRKLDFTFPSTGNAQANQILRNFETPFDNPARTRDTRGFFKLDEQLGRHQLTQEVNYTNGVVKEFLPLSASNSLPSRRNDTTARSLLLGFGDTVLFGEQSNPWVLTLRGGYRGDVSSSAPSHPEAGVGTTFQIFNSFTTGGLAGNLGSVSFGNNTSPSLLDQKYTSLGANLAKLFGDHNLKFGWNFLRTRVDGIESQILNLQLFATVNDFLTYGPINSGFFTVTTAGGLTPEANEIHLRNNYHGIFFQDDWRFWRNLTLNVGLRWDYDSEFRTKEDISPRVGFAWAATPKTVIRGHFGRFYDQFRLNIARDVPGFGGADRRVVQPFSYPRGFYGVPTIAPAAIGASLFVGGLCVSPNLTDAEIAASGAKCPAFGGGPANQFIGRDRLNRVVASGHALIPADAVINISNIQQLSGLTPQQYADAASVAVGKAPGFFFWGPFGALSHAAIPGQILPTSVDATFKTPFTNSYSIGVQREIGRDLVIQADYYHRDMHNILGVRESNISFVSRAGARTFLPPFSAGAINTFGPWYKGEYDAFIASFNKRLSRRFILNGDYAWARETDNQLGINSLPSDSFIGIAPVVSSTEAGVPRTNADGPYTRANGRFVAQANTFVYGPDLDKGPSDLSVDHTFQLNGLLELPWQVQISGIFRAQSGFHFSRSSPTADPDGDGTLNGIDVVAGRNAFTSPAFVNLDMRFAKRFNLGERARLHVLFEFFNLLNRQNPAAVETTTTNANLTFGALKQVLPGREGQIGVRLEF
ncbi:MAG TPA: TonB-dependent receptor [Pyrinomonadaceae bacterium]|nr:TonB-dependent receptor [Pyrinomonadaceae bacterium]